MDAAGQTPAKHASFVHNLPRETIELRAAGAKSLAEPGKMRQPDDRSDAGPAPMPGNGTPAIAGQPIGVTLVVDGVSRTIRTSEQTVGGVLAAEHLSPRLHDRVRPRPATTLAPQDTIELTRATSWLEHIRSTIVPPVRHRYDVTMMRGTQRVVDPGRPGTEETTVAVLQPNPAVSPKRVSIADRILRLPRTKIVAEGVANTLGAIAQRGILGTFRLADAALKMIATAYTAGCSGCSGLTASGRPAGHGIVAVDPRYIPLGTHLFIPGYGHAYAGDTGGSIRGNRIDLGFDTHRDAVSFGRRAIVVYVVK